MKKINVLGTEYIVAESNENLDSKLKGVDGYCDTSIHYCCIDTMEEAEKDDNCKRDLDKYKRQVMRHELIHAFLYESGLDVCSWAENEELVDWLAIQFPKMQKAFEEAGCKD